MRQRIVRASCWRSYRMILVVGIAVILLQTLYYTVSLTATSSNVTPPSTTPILLLEPSSADTGAAATAVGPKLRFDWTNLPVTSPFAKSIYNHQHNCSLPLANFESRNRYGLGSDLHIWTQALCNGMQSGHRIRSQPPWIYWDNSRCVPASHGSFMECYFPQAELQCPNDQNVHDAGAASAADSATTTYLSHKGAVSRGGCHTVLQQASIGIPGLRAAGIEYLFSSLSELVIREAERQLAQVFGDSPTIDNHNLITVHIRWGDKKAEMKLVPISKYIQAVHELATSDPVHIFLSTEDPDAVQQFQMAALEHNWAVYIDAYYHELLPYRNAEYNGNPKMTKNLAGSPGLKALGSLLVAMQANHFVLTTGSNWSRLMNELRLQVLNPRCGNCTRMIDLHAGEW